MQRPARLLAVDLRLLRGRVADAEPAPDGFPATLLWDFRIASLGTQVVLWTALGLAYAALLHHRTRDRETAPATP